MARIKQKIKVEKKRSGIKAKVKPEKHKMGPKNSESSKNKPDLKIYKVKDNAYLMYSGNIAKGKSNMWIPSKDEFKTKNIFEKIQGKEFVAFDNIIGGVEGADINLHIGKNNGAESEVFSVSPEYLEETNKTVKRYDPPTEESSPSAWWSKEGLKVVRLKIEGFTDGFMGFVKKKDLIGVEKKEHGGSMATGGVMEGEGKNSSKQKYVVTIFDTNKGYRTIHNMPSSKEVAEKRKRDLEHNMRISIPKYKYAKDIRVEKWDDEKGLSNEYGGSMEAGGINGVDKLTMDIPLYIRTLEYAKEDAKTDMDLHKITENATNISKSKDVLTMKDYDSIVNINESMATGGKTKEDFKIGDKVKYYIGGYKDEDLAHYGTIQSLEGDYPNYDKRFARVSGLGDAVEKDKLIKVEGIAEEMFPEDAQILKNKYKSWRERYDYLGAHLEDAIEEKDEAKIKKLKTEMDELESKMHRYERNYNKGGKTKGFTYKDGSEINVNDVYQVGDLQYKIIDMSKNKVTYVTKWKTDKEWDFNGKSSMSIDNFAVKGIFNDKTRISPAPTKKEKKKK